MFKPHLRQTLRVTLMFTYLMLMIKSVFYGFFRRRYGAGTARTRDISGLVTNQT